MLASERQTLTFPGSKPTNKLSPSLIFSLLGESELTLRPIPEHAISEKKTNIKIKDFNLYLFYYEALTPATQASNLLRVQRTQCAFVLALVSDLVDWLYCHDKIHF